MTTLFTILFDGVAYGMLLFVLACGLAVTLGLMNFVNLAHGAFAMTGGYVCAVLVNQIRLAVLRRAAARLRRQRRDRRGAGAHALPPSLHPQPSRPGAVHASASSSCRWRRSITSWARRGSSSSCRRRCEGQIDFFGVGIGRYRLMIIVICGLLTVALQLILAKHPVRQPAARRGRRSARRQRPRHQRAAGVRASPLRSAAALPASAARSAPRSSGSIRISR